jgi:hypothetical protein
MADRYPYPGAAAVRDSHGGARSTENDPLAELARLIGQTDPNAFAQAQRPAAAPAVEDRYQHHRQDQYQEQYEPEAEEPAPPSWMRNASAASWQQQPAAPTMHPVAHEQQHYDQQEEQDPQYSDTPAFLRTARQHDQSRYDDVLYDQNSQNHPHYASGGYQQDGYQDQQDPNAYQPFYEDEPQEEPARKRGGLMTVVAVLALAIVGTAAAYGYRSYTGAPRSGEPPVIKAEQGSTKIVPPTQMSDASGKIPDRISGSGGPERVVSREEQPIDMNARNGQPRVVFPPLNQGGAQPAVVPVAPVPPQQVANGALSDEPKRVRTTTIRPDQPDTAPQGAAAAPRPPASARAQATGPVQLSPQANAAPAAPAPVRAAPAGGSGGFMVQVSSQRSDADAQASYRALQSKFPNVLGSRSASIRRADLGEKGIYYRAMVGPFAAAEEAGQLCDSLKSAGGSCVVQRN